MPLPPRRDPSGLAVARVVYNEQGMPHLIHHPSTKPMLTRTLLASILACALVVGCATPQSARTGPPAYTSTSAKPAVEVFECIANAWEAQGHASEMNTRPTSVGYTLTLARIANTLAVVDVLKAETGSTTNLYWGSILGGGELKDAVQHCQ